uniref:Uncharacterized protein n=1 Tax=Lactuca sativa TaxID=4236 RepID=A0A9R1XII1_LACSA|nr:hypothetical protein LSAT_V11C400226550 [Lactuca sativa]
MKSVFSGRDFGLIPPPNRTQVGRPKKKRRQSKGERLSKRQKASQGDGVNEMQGEHSQGPTNDGVQKLSRKHITNARIRDTTLGPVKGKVGINLRSDFGCLLWCNDYLVAYCLKLFVFENFSYGLMMWLCMVHKHLYA